MTINVQTEYTIEMSVEELNRLITDIMILSTNDSNDEDFKQFREIAHKNAAKIAKMLSESGYYEVGDNK